jgi:hypothetical protein
MQDTRLPKDNRIDLRHHWRLASGIDHADHVFHIVAIAASACANLIWASGTPETA